MAQDELELVDYYYGYKLTEMLFYLYYVVIDEIKYLRKPRLGTC